MGYIVPLIALGLASEDKSLCLAILHVHARVRNVVIGSVHCLKGHRTNSIAFKAMTTNELGVWNVIKAAGW